MLVYPLATAALLLVVDSASAATTTASKPSSSTKIDFMRAMNKRVNKRRRKLSLKDFQAEVRGDSQRSAELRKKMMEKSTVVKPPGSAGGDRKLQNYNQNENANANGYDANYNANKNYKYNQNHDGTDDYFMAYGEWENNFGFDPTMFSLAYHRCAEVRQFDDEIAAQEDTTSVFATKHFAVFRFCPEQTCMGWQEEDADCGCEDQCYNMFEEMANNGWEEGDNDEEYCEEACQDQCDIWQQQYDLYSGDAYTNAQDMAEAEEAANGNRKLQNYYNNNGNSQNQYQQMTFDPYYAQNQDEDVYGAQGEGCQNNYGEYMIEMKDYLDLIMEWQEERFEQYCEYCEECMFNVYQVWLQNGGQRERHLEYEDFKNSDEHQKMRALGNYYNACPEYDTCAEYTNMCKGGVQDDYSDYFECTEVERANGQVAYIGLHCAEDGFELTLGVYSDEYCNEYIGNGVDIANFLGEELEEDALKSYYNSAFGPTLEQLQFVQEDNVCISCRKEDLLWTEPGNGGDDDSVNYDSTEINELCENLYEVSARCDKHYRSYNSRTKQAKYAQAMAQEDLTCDFIDSVVMGNYNEMGQVNLGANYNKNSGQAGQGWAGNNMYAQQVQQGAAEVSPLQIFGLIMSILAVVLLGVWSSSLHRSLTKTGPWRPRRGLQRPATSPTDGNPDLSRQNSGIVLGRSASNTSYYMS